MITQNNNQYKDGSFVQNSKSIYDHCWGYWNVCLFGKVSVWIDNIGYILGIQSVSHASQSYPVRYKKILFCNNVTMIIYNARNDASVQGWINKTKNNNNVEIVGK